MNGFQTAQPPKKDKPKRDPESEFYDTIKQKPVRVRLSDGTVLKGVLRWVHTYSLCVEGVAGHVLVMKGGMSTIEALTGE